MNGIKDGTWHADSFEYFSLSYRNAFDILLGLIDMGQSILATCFPTWKRVDIRFYEIFLGFCAAGKWQFDKARISHDTAKLLN